LSYRSRSLQTVYLPWQEGFFPALFLRSLPVVAGRGISLRFFSTARRGLFHLPRARILMLLMITPPIACGRREGIVFEILIGVWLLVGSFLPKAKFYPGRLGTKQILPLIKPSWIPRLFIMAAGLAAILNGVWRIRHH
jgi:hypothetical protein